MFKGLRLSWVSLYRFAQYSLDHSFCFWYFCFVLCIYFDVSNKADKLKINKINSSLFIPTTVINFVILCFLFTS